MGANCIWLLPILESPMKDAGYDVSDYKSIRSDLVQNGSSLTSLERLKIFQDFIEEAHKNDIHIIFDVVLNHCSNEHIFFQHAINNKNSEYLDYFIWDDKASKYQDTRIIFEGICKSNWEYNENVSSYYLHRFYPEQPDWNYKNPKVLLHILDIFVFWKKLGIDGFRLDAIPFLWKEEGTNCESLPQCHTIIKIIRAVLDYFEEGTLLLAEACQPTAETVCYFGEDDECHGAYHFPLMPKIFLSLATQNPKYISEILQSTQEIPPNCQWFLFLRCHDELTLEMSSAEEKKILNGYYCQQQKWKFREGSGISARLFDLFGEDVARTKLAFSILLTLSGTPILYYGDEFALQNDDTFYNWMTNHTGYEDSRNLCRNKIDWQSVENNLKDKNSPPTQIHNHVQKLLSLRNKSEFHNHKIEFIDFTSVSKEILAYQRIGNHHSYIIIHNLGSEQIEYNTNDLDILENQKISHLAPLKTVIFRKE